MHTPQVRSRVMTQAVVSEPLARSALQLSTRLAALISHGATDDDPRVIEARSELAFYRVRRAIDAEAGQLSAQSVDLLVRDLMSTVVAK